MSIRLLSTLDLKGDKYEYILIKREWEKAAGGGGQACSMYTKRLYGNMVVQ